MFGGRGHGGDEFRHNTRAMAIFSARSNQSTTTQTAAPKDFSRKRTKRMFRGYK